MQQTIKKITDVITIAGPAAIAVAGAISAAGADYMSAGIDILTIVLGAVSSIASVIYNLVTKTKGAK